MLGIWGTSYQIGCRIPNLIIFNCHIGHDKLIYTWNTLDSLILIMISPFYSHLSLCHLQLHHHLRTWKLVFPFYISMAWFSVNTKYNTHWVQHQPRFNCLLHPASLLSLNSHVMVDHLNHYALLIKKPLVMSLWLNRVIAPIGPPSWSTG